MKKIYNLQTVLPHILIGLLLIFVAYMGSAQIPESIGTSANDIGKSYTAGTRIITGLPKYFPDTVKNETLFAMDKNNNRLFTWNPKSSRWEVDKIRGNSSSTPRMEVLNSLVFDYTNTILQDSNNFKYYRWDLTANIWNTGLNGTDTLTNYKVFTPTIANVLGYKEIYSGATLPASATIYQTGNKFLLTTDSTEYTYQGNHVWFSNIVKGTATPLQRVTSGTEVFDNSRAVWKNPNISVISGQTTDFTYQNNAWKPLKDLYLYSFGGINDGTTDNYTAIQKAITYQNDIVIDGGTYYIGTTINLPASVRLIFKNGGKLKFGALVNISSQIIASNYDQIFDTTGLNTNLFIYPTATNNIPFNWFGAKANGSIINGGTPVAGVGQDNSPYFDYAIKCGILVGNFYIPGHRADSCYRISRTLNLQSSYQFPLKSFYIRGVKGRQVNTNSLASAIFADFTSGCAINIANQFYSKIEDFAILGKNFQPNIITSGTSAAADSLNYLKSWVSNGIDTSRYTFYCGIGIDSAVLIANRTISGSIYINNVTIDGFVVGIATSVGGNNQGDDAKLRDCFISHCAYGVSIGNSQNRDIDLNNLQVLNGFTAVTNRHFSNKDGSAFNVTDGEWLGVVNLFECGMETFGNSNIQGLYVENAGRIGSFGTNGGNTANGVVAFSGCHFSFNNDGFKGTIHFKPLQFDIIYAANITFTSCNFESLTSTFTTLSLGNTGFTTFIGCYFYGYTDLLPAPNSKFVNCNSSGINAEVNERVFFTSDKTGATNKIYISEFVNNVNTTPDVTSEGTAQEKTLNISRDFARRSYVLSDPQVKFTSFTGSTGVINYGTNGYFNGLRPTDIIWKTLFTSYYPNYKPAAQVPAFRVTAYDKVAKTITVDIITPYADTSFANTSNYCGFTYRTFVANKHIYADVNYGSATITNVTNASILAVGDFVRTSFLDIGSFRVESVSGTTVVLNTPVYQGGRLEFFSTMANDPSMPGKSIKTNIGIPNVNASYVGDEFYDYSDGYYYKATIAGSTTPINDWSKLVYTNSLGFTGINKSLSGNAPQYMLDVDGSTGWTGNPIRLNGLQAGSATDSIVTSASGVLKRQTAAQVVQNGITKTSVTSTFTVPASGEYLIPFTLTGTTNTSIVAASYIATDVTGCSFAIPYLAGDGTGTVKVTNKTASPVTFTSLKVNFAVLSY